MNPIISIVGIVIAAIVQLAVGHLQRKQMRQIELYRNDSTAPLRPPPSPVVAWIKKRGPLLMCVLPIAHLIFTLNESIPINRADVLSIALDVGMVVFLVNTQATLAVLDLITRMSDTVRLGFDVNRNAINKMQTSVSQMTDLHGEQVQVMDKIADRHLALSERVNAIENQSD